MSCNLQILRYSRYLMLLGGVWRLPYFEDPKAQSLYKLYSLAIQSAFFLGCFFMCEEFVWLLRVDDMRKLTFNMKITFPASLICLKLIVFQSDKFSSLLSELIESEQRFATSKDPQALNLYLTCQRYVDKCSKAILILAGGTGGFLILGTSVTGLTGCHDPSVEKPMMFLAQFHFDQNVHYGSALLLQAVIVVLAILYFCLCPILYVSTLGFIKAKLQILQHQFRNFDLCKRRMSLGVDDVGMMKTLILSHQFIIRFVTELNETIRTLILIEFLLSSVNIACVTFQLISVNSVTDDIFTLCFLFVLFGQLLVLAWPANDINIESIGVSTAIYDFLWYEKSILVKNMARIVLMRAQTPLKLTIGMFNPLTTDTVIKVLNGAYSYVTIMTNN